MRVMEFIMRLKKTTETKACFKENMERVGRVYLPLPLLDKLGIGDEMIIQLAPDKSLLPPGGYVAQFVFDKETRNKVRYAEKITECGELGMIYVSKKILENMNVEDEIAVRIIPSPKEGGAYAADV